MSERLIDPDTGRPLAPRRTSRGPGRGGPVVVAVAVVVAYALAGAAAGWMWFTLWSPSEGIVVDHQWYPVGAALREDFSGTGLYVLVAVSWGAVFGVLGALLGGRRPVLVLIAAVAGSVLAAWLMLEVGQRLGPPDPQVLARTAENRTRLPGALRVNGLTPLAAFPFGTLAALAAIFTIFPGKTPEAGFRGEPPG